MKRVIAVLTVLILGIGIASAQPPGKGPMIKHKTLQTSEDYESVKKGDTLLMVCMECKAVAEMTAESDGQGMELCKEGNTIVCASCKKGYKTVRVGPPGKEHAVQKVTIVNAEGKECMFITKKDSGD